jgi:hypothetical protein
VKWFQRKPVGPLRLVDEKEPWLDWAIVINGKPTTLRIVRRFAMDMSEVDYRNPAEQGMGMTIVALVDEISWLNARLLDAQKKESTDEHRSS